MNYIGMHNVHTMIMMIRIIEIYKGNHVEDYENDYGNHGQVMQDKLFNISMNGMLS